MISLESVENTILELESKDTSFATCERLAWLYIVRDHIKEYELEKENKLSPRGKSDFMQAVNGRNADAVWSIIDELVDTIRIIHPRMYEEVMQRIRDL